MFSIMLLVTKSVAVSSLIAYLERKTELTRVNVKSNANYVTGRADMVEAMSNEKVKGIRQISKQFPNKPITGTPDEIIEFIKLVASAIEEMDATANSMAIDATDTARFTEEATAPVNNHGQFCLPPKRL